MKIVGLGKSFKDGTRALSDICLDVSKGEFVVILGPSGSGKTTLLRCINGLVTADTGTVTVEGQKVTDDNLRKVRERVGMIFQDFNLVGNLTVLNNVLTGLLDRSNPLLSLLYLFKREHKLLALECLDRVGILGKAYTRADRLSGGQQQRVGIARAIIKRPVLLLADEPVASLDPIISRDILSLLKDINLAYGITVVCNLHQVDLALRFADRVIGLSGGQIVVDRPVGEVDETYIQHIYRDHDQGLFFGSAIDQPRPEASFHFTP